jgi:predicted PurR-regulated permease PerM
MAEPTFNDVGLRETAHEPRDTSALATAHLHAASDHTGDGYAERVKLQHVQAASLVILATAAVLGMMYIAKVILVVVLSAILLSFVLAPVVDGLTKLQIPRTVGALVAVLLLVVMVGAVFYLSYARALDFMSQMPEYRTRVQHIVNAIRMEAEKFEKTTETVLPEEPEDKNTVTIRERNSLGHFLSRNMSAFSELLLTVSFVPFLVYFMLSWNDHVRASSVMLFKMENRNTAYVALGQISAMIRSFIVGNLMIGLFLSAASTAAFGLMGLPYFYFLGVISGFLSLIPYLGVVLAILPPVIVGIGYLTTTTFILTCAVVVGLHLFAMNVLYPMVLGKRLQLNPLAVTLALLFWGWLWGAMGLLLAVPLTGALKIVCDNIDRLRPFGAWMGE